MAFTAVTLNACTSSATKSAADTQAEPQAVPTAQKEIPISGGYGSQRAVTAEDTALFDAMTSGLKGVVYTADSVSTQVVAGLNYRFTCDARTIAPEPKTYRMEIVVYQPLPNHGEPRITSLKRL